MERLTNHFSYCECAECKYYDEELAKCNKCKIFITSTGHCHDKKVWEKLREYEDLEEQGLLLKLPCKVGTNKLYYIDDDKEIYRINGDEVSIKRFPSGQIIYDYDCYEFSYEDFGKTVFLTKEEAEKALERLEKDNELY